MQLQLQHLFLSRQLELFCFRLSFRSQNQHQPMRWIKWTPRLVTTKSPNSLRPNASAMCRRHFPEKTASIRSSHFRDEVGILKKARNADICISNEQVFFYNNDTFPVGWPPGNLSVVYSEYIQTKYYVYFCDNSRLVGFRHVFKLVHLLSSSYKYVYIYIQLNAMTRPSGSKTQRPHRRCKAFSWFLRSKRI